MFKARMKRLTVRMAETKTDGVFIGPTSNMKWLAGFDPHGDERPVMLVVGPKSAAFLMPALNADSARQHTDLPFHTWSDAQGAAVAFGKVLSETGISSVTNPSIALDENHARDFAPDDRRCASRRENDNSSSIRWAHCAQPRTRVNTSF
ncbi:hypothetical protein HKX68_20760 [Dickeya dadantii]|nr:aminopeptidase P family N-terminal domain-containing protein [Dickeya dadantii]NPE65153.1 hypothetical protein [Dickeya dadantii]